MTMEEKSHLTANSAGLKSYTESSAHDSSHTTHGDKLTLRRNVSLFHATGVVISATVGAGVFITPQLIYISVGSIGFSFIVWIFTGLFTILLSWCYLELALILPSSGGEYAYASAIGGDMLAMSIWWMNIILYFPGAGGVMAQGTALYVTSVFGFSDSMSVKIILSLMLIGMYTTDM